MIKIVRGKPLIFGETENSFTGEEKVFQEEKESAKKPKQKLELVVCFMAYKIIKSRKAWGA